MINEYFEHFGELLQRDRQFHELFKIDEFIDDLEANYSSAEREKVAELLEKRLQRSQEQLHWWEERLQETMSYLNDPAKRELLRESFSEVVGAEALENLIDESTALSHIHMGLAAETFEEKIDYFKKALEMGNKDAHIHLGIAYLEQDSFDEAVRELRTALEEGTAYVSACHGFLSLTYLEAGQTKKALKEAKKAISVEPDNSGLYGVLGMVYLKLGKTKKARKQVSKGLDVGRTSDKRFSRCVIGSLSPQAQEASEKLRKHHEEFMMKFQKEFDEITRRRFGNKSKEGYGSVY